MTHAKTCRQCGKPFEANRADAIYCSARCTAQYYRDNPNPDYEHAYKQHVHWFTCDECGQGYVVNDYANRGGKRAPRFCSVKCKQRAYRARVNAQAARRQEQTAQPNGQPPPNGGQSGQQSTGGQQSRQQDTGPHKKRTSRGEQRDPYKILGVSIGATKAQIRAAWHKLVRDNHPDKHMDEFDKYNAMVADINWAYNTLTR